jgi:hypothetical protein
MFNDFDSTVLELRNPEDIGVAEMNMHLARFANKEGYFNIRGNKHLYVPDI